MLPVNQWYPDLGFSDAGVTNTFTQDSNNVISRISQCLPAGLPKLILPRESRSDHVTPLPSIVTRKYRKCLRPVRPSMIWPLCVSLTPTPSSTAPLSLLFMTPPCFRSSKAPSSPQGLCTGCSLAYNGPPPNFPVTGFFLPFIPKYRLLRGRHHPKKPTNLVMLLHLSASLSSWRWSRLDIFLFICFVQRRQWQATPVLLPGDSQGRGSLVGCRRWGRTESGTTEAPQQQQHRLCLGGGFVTDVCHPYFYPIKAGTQLDPCT